ncbi:hypothetical protein HNQ51_002090 [Inhella inkyongensis]|uniref:Uncharacterized protein n=1 Tax=Inhella inkyongensis TaxID=392593 RepID=A0A840S700_9BURK|nr:hypothetical protein [Inhella inkyongensis]MBB5204776.1 hypothetical protein [Inhella inkyongensis]
MKNIAFALAFAMLLPTYLPSGRAHATSIEDPKTVALLGYAGDRFQLVRKREAVGSNQSPYVRKEVKLKGPELSRLVLAGLDKAAEVAFPAAQRVQLEWQPDEALLSQLDSVRGSRREAMMEAAVLAHLRALPQRQEWDQIIVVLPKFQFSDAKGLGGQLMGMGVYVQPLEKSQLDVNGLSLDPLPSDSSDDPAAINPATGERVTAFRYTAPYFFFQTLTLDAKSLMVLKRVVRLDNLKYANPDDQHRGSQADLSSDLLAKAMGRLVERSAMRTVGGDVTVGPVKPVAPAPKQP